MSKAPRAPKTKQVLIRLSEEEHARIKGLAEESGMSMAALMRDHLGHIKIRNRDDEKKRIAMLNRINSNINQIARFANTYKESAEALGIISALLSLDKKVDELNARLGELAK